MRRISCLNAQVNASSSRVPDDRVSLFGSALSPEKRGCCQCSHSAGVESVLTAPPAVFLAGPRRFSPKRAPFFSGHSFTALCFLCALACIRACRVTAPAHTNRDRRWRAAVSGRSVEDAVREKAGVTRGVLHVLCLGSARTETAWRSVIPGFPFMFASSAGVHV